MSGPKGSHLSPAPEDAELGDYVQARDKSAIDLESTSVTYATQYDSKFRLERWNVFETCCSRLQIQER